MENKTLIIAIHYLIEKDDENAFDILLEEFSETATKEELRIGIRVLENLILDLRHGE